MPIAGPDYFSEKGIKGLFKTNEGPLLKNILESRPWFINTKFENYIFIMKENKESFAFFHDYIQSWFPKSKAIFLSDFTRGAALSVLTGIGYCIDEKESPLLIDLADIKFNVFNQDINNLFNSNNTDAYIYTFKSNNECYSYAKANNENIVLEIAEKKVISSNAITGVYLFRSPSIYLEAISNASGFFKKFVHKNLLYVSPILNTLIENKKEIKIINTALEKDFSSQFNY